ncbi:MAG: hypothetical protein IKU70_08000 [Clostridia bacterium]|nr:hypothetical protein [Clostridia bacterium]
MKKMMALILALILCLSSVSALALESNINLDSTWPVVKEKIPVTIGVVPQNNGEYDLDNVWTLQYFEEMSNLDITWQHIERASAPEKIPLMLAGDTMPDAILGYSKMNHAALVQYGVDEGMLYPIDTLLDYMPNFKAMLDAKPAVKASLYASDGHFYGLPVMADGSDSYILRFFINSDWLKNVGKEMPTTLDEFYDVLVAFRDQDANGNGDPSDEIPVSAAWNEGYSLRAWILNSLGFCTTGNNTAYYYKEDGSYEAAYIPYRSEYKEYLTYMNKLWNEGLLDLDMFTQTQAQVDAKLTDKRSGFTTVSAPQAVDPTSEFSWEAAKPLTSALNATPIQPKSAPIGNPGYFFINSNCDEETAAALANFGDAFFTVDLYNILQVGPEYVEGEAPAMTAEGPQYMSGYGAFWNEETKARDWVFDTANYASAWAFRTTVISTWAHPGYNGNGNDEWIIEWGTKYPESTQGKFVANGMKHDTWRISANKWQTPYAKFVMPSLFYTAEDQATANEIATMMNDYVAGMEAKFITGELSIEADYDNFVKTLEEYGVNGYMDILNKYVK